MKNIDNAIWTEDLRSIEWGELSTLYQIALLGDKSPNMLKKVFKNSMFTYFIYDNNKLIGAGRALADGADSAYLCDIAIHPEYQGIGLGKEITKKLLDCVKSYNKIILFASIGKEGFYSKLGFAKMTTAMAIFKHQERVMEIGLIEKDEI